MECERLLDALEAGCVMLDAHLLNIPGMAGQYYTSTLRDLRGIVASWPKDGKAANPADVDLARNELLRLEAELILESAAEFGVPAYSSRRLWSFIGDVKAVAARNAALKNETQNHALDWQNCVVGLKRRGVNLELDTAVERFQLDLDAAFTNAALFRGAFDPGAPLPNRLWEQRYALYVPVINELIRNAAGVIELEDELAAWRRAVALRREQGAKLSGVETSLARAAKALDKYRRRFDDRSGYAARLASEQLARAAMAELRRAATAADGQSPAIWPGAFVYSTGRFALGGSWHSLLTSEINHYGLFLDKKETFRVDQDDKFEWAFSFAPPDAGDFQSVVLDQSWTHMTRRYRFGNLQEQEVTWSVLAPGVLVNTPGPAAQLADLTMATPLPPDKVVAVLNGAPTIVERGKVIAPKELTENWLLLLTENGAPQFPVLVVMESRPEQIAWTESGLELRNKSGVGRMAVALPFGAAGFASDWSAKWTSVPDAVLRQVRALVPRLTWYPLSVEDFFALDGDRVRVWSRIAQATELKGEFCRPGHPYVPLPPIYALSLHADLGLQVVSPLSAPVLMTKYGPYRVTDAAVLEYSLPRPVMRERVELRPADGKEEWLQRLNDACAALGSEYSRFSEVGAALPAYLMLNQENRRRIQFYKNWPELDGVIGGRIPYKPLYNARPATSESNILVDPATGRAYWSRGWRGSRHDVRMRGDITTFPAMHMDAVNQYARFFGQWDLAERHWEKFARDYSVLPGRHDWAIQGHDCMETGMVFDKDMLGDGWRGHQAMKYLAETLGHEKERNLAEYLGAAALLSAATLGHPARIPYGLRIHNLPAMLVSDDPFAYLGAREQRMQISGRDRQEMGNWSALYALAGCAIWDYPIFDGLFTLYPAVGHYQFRQYAQRWPFWHEKEYFKASPGVAVVCTCAYLNYLAWTGADAAEIEAYWQKLFACNAEGCIGNTRFQWNVLNALPAFIACDHPVWLVAWGKARLLDGVYDRKKRLAVISLAAAEDGVLELCSALPPQTVAVNGVESGADRYAYQAAKHALKIPFGPGPQRIEIQWAADRSPGGRPGILEIANKPVPFEPMERAPAPGRLTFKVLTGDIRTGRTAPVDLRRHVNMGWQDKHESDQKGGTHDDGEWWNVPSGTVVVRGVPFDLINPELNDGKSCMVLKGLKKLYFPASSTGIEVGKRVRRVFFFHGYAYPVRPGEVILTYRLHFKGGAVRELHIRQDQQIGGCKIPSGESGNASAGLPDLPDTRGSQAFPPTPGKPHWGAGFGGSVYLWTSDVMDVGVTAEGNMQRALDTLESIDVIAPGDKAVAMVYAITVELAE